MIVILHRTHLFGEQSTGAILSPLIAFFDNHVTLCLDIGWSEKDVAHPVTFHTHHQLKTVRRNTLIVCCIVVTGERVVTATIGRNYSRKLARF